jgi:hypothetical protein
MTAYRTIATTEVAEDAPVTSLLLTALMNNLLAVIENDATAPSISAQALDSPPVGSNDSWQDVSGSRVFGTTYRNQTGQTIEVCVGLLETGSGFAGFQVSLNGSTWVTIAETGGAISVTASIADDEYYRTLASGGGVAASYTTWTERRP